MIEQRTLAEVIQAKLALGPVNARGFHPVVCQVCGDYQERGGFKLDADTTGYFCWNCKASFKYEEGTGRLSKNARRVLESFGITREDLTAIQSPLFAKAKEADEVSLEDLRKVKLHTPEVALPDRHHLLGDDGYDELQGPLIEYLLNRKIDPLAVRAGFSLDPRFLRRVIIPYYRDGKVIYWQARSIDSGVKPRYLNCSISKEAVLYGYDRLFTYDPAPLFVTEGVFDAIAISGICLLGSALNEAKREILRRCRRRVIFVIDRDRTGGELAKEVLENGWELSFVDARVADANDSVVRFGLPYTIHTLLKNTTRSPVLASLGVTLGNLGRYR